MNTLFLRFRKIMNRFETRILHPRQGDHEYIHSRERQEFHRVRMGVPINLADEA